MVKIKNYREARFYVKIAEKTSDPVINIAIDTIVTNFCDLKYLALEANNPQIIQHLVKILAEPHKTAYGSFEFVIEDVDGRQIGIGRIFDKAVYFKNSDINA